MDKEMAPPNEWHNHSNDEWQQFVFLYCITNWTKHL